MRKLAYALALSLALGLGGWLGWRYGAMSLPDLLTAPANAEKMALVSQSSVNIAYLVDTGQWLNFSIPDGTQQIKLITNASTADADGFRRQRAVDPARRWNYALEIEVSDASGKLLIQRQHHHRADLVESRWPDGRVSSPAFFLRENLTPLSGAMLHLDLEGLPQASHLRVRLASKDADLTDVILRTFLPERNSEQRAAVLWQRLSDKQKESLARGSVYPPELLIEQEKRNLLLHSWRAVGPKGAEGRDYRQRELYVLLDKDGEAVDDPILPFGVLADQRVRATIPIPRAGGLLRLVFQASPRAAGQALAATDRQLQLRWHGTTQFERSQVNLDFAEAIRRGHQQRIAGGLLEIAAPDEISVRAYLRSSETAEEEEITPLPQYLRVFLAEAATPVSFALENRQEISLLRLELRQLRHATTGHPAEAGYSIVDGEGRVLKEGRLPLNMPDSQYERVVGDYSGAWLSDPGVHHFALPASARLLRISPLPAAPGEVPAPLLVSAATRPPGLAREVRIPDDYFDYAATGQRLPAWFAIRPDSYETRIINNLSRVLAIQARPSEDNPDLLAGRYQWEDYRPGGNWLARPIYAPREAGSPYREDILPSTFSPLPAGPEREFDFPVYQGMRVVSPTLIRLGDGQPFSLQLSIDGQPPLLLRGQGPFAELSLPPLAVGRHRLRLVGTGQVYVNFVRPVGAALVRRMAQRFDGSLSFEYERRTASEETLTLRLYQSATEAVPASLSASISGPPMPLLTPLQGWVFARRQASIQAASGTPAVVFGTRGERCDAGQPLFIPFSADAPPGKYRIVVKAERARAAYLTLSRLGPPVQAERRAHTQVELNRVEFSE